LCVAATLLAAPSFASIPDLPRTDAPIDIDGVLGDAGWQGALAVDLGIQTHPGENVAAPVRTTVYLTEDSENLYIAFDAKDPDTAAIRAYLRDRDSAYRDDIVGIVLDTYNDDRRAFQFFVNPLGVQMDMTNDDINGNEDDSWDAIWNSAGQINGDGYVVEIQIPLDQLRFPHADGEQTWGYDVLRFYPREHRYRLSNNPLDRGRNCYLCQLGEFKGLEGLEPGRDLEIVPTVTALRSSTTDEPGVIPMESGDTDVEAGLTVRWGITPDMTASLAINPDFSQVEADVAQLDVNERFALSFPETRPFFLEGADYFKTPFEAVFTRTVSDPEIAAKLTGKRGNHTIASFAARDEETTLLFPGIFGSDSTTLEQENTAFVGRYAYGFGDASQLGALVTIREGDGYHNRVGGLDGRWKINDQHSLEFQLLRSDTEYPVETAVEFEQPLGTFDGHASIVSYEYDSRNWFGEVEYGELSDGFRVDSGFQRRVGGSKQELELGRVWHGTDANWWHRIVLRGEHRNILDESGTSVERTNSLVLGMGGPRQSWYQIRVNKNNELFEGVRYDMDVLGLYAQMTPRSGLSFSLFVRAGDRIDYSNERAAKELLFEPTLDWNVNRNLLIRLRGVLSQLETLDNEEIFTASVADLRLTWQFSVRSYLRLTLQHEDIERNPDVYIDEVDAREKDVGRELLYSYKLNPRTVFYLGYSDHYVDDDSLNGLTETDENWFMKIGYAWTP
jgi:hypothetical protein